MTKPSLPQGTRDFGPDTVRKRNYILNTIRNVFELYGYQPLETPAMENLDTLMGKYGDEGDKLIFRILDSGNPFKAKFFQQLGEYLKEYSFMSEKLGADVKNFINPFRGPFWELNPEVLEPIAEDLLRNADDRNKYLSRLKYEVSDKALKYDLTIPFARYVAMNHSQLVFPFKRYQIQPVWRADRPQKGRYREFYQCDADVVGSDSLLNETELALIYHQVFTELKINNYQLIINHRKILTALAELCGGTDKMNDIAIAIDKLDKIGFEKVKDELKQKGFSTSQLITIEKYISISGNNDEKLIQLEELVGKTEAGKKGTEELRLLINSKLTTHDSRLTIDPTLARGLNYYTGIIFEAKAPAEIKIGSIGGGGRYDDLTGLFGVPGIPGVGISFGVDRIYDVLEEMKLFPENLQISTKVLFFNLGEKESHNAFVLMQQLRNKGISCELFHESLKFDKQFKYAEKKNIPFVIIIGSKELEEKTCTIKNLLQGVQQTIPQQELLNYKF